MIRDLMTPRAGVTLTTAVALALAPAACGTETATSIGPSPVERCAIAVPSSQLAVGEGGGTVALAVETEQECEWSVTGAAAWITAIEPLSGQGSGDVQITAARNAGPSRSTTLTVGGATVTIVQASGCAYAVAPQQVQSPATGGPVSISIETGEGCSWQAVPADNWITVSAASGTGSATIVATAAPNSGPERTGTVMIADRRVTITQASGCTYALAPTAAVAPSAGGEGVIQVSSSVGCVWTAESHAPWIVILEGRTGSGTGEVRYRVEPAAFDAPLPRIGTLIVAGRTFPITQARIAVPR